MPTSIRLPSTLRARLDALLSRIAAAEGGPFARVTLHAVLLRAVEIGVAEMEREYGRGKETR